MAIKRAKVLDDEQVKKLLRYIDANSTLPERDRLVILLSFRAGLRVAEIAKIDFAALTDAECRIAKTIYIFANVAKRKREREIPMSRDIKQALERFYATYPTAPFIAFSSQPFRWAARQGREVTNPVYKRMSPKTLAGYYRDLILRAGFEGASSHSGRRTFATNVSRILSEKHCSLRDLQKLMGHARLDTTERYLEPSKEVGSLVDAW